MKIQPVPGRLVRDPATGREVTAVTEVPDNDPFWLRRLADGDVARADVSTDAKSTKKGAE
ncbi:MAG: DUF2635 domain-containing protein [Pseudomonadota bacterium]